MDSHFGHSFGHSPIKQGGLQIDFVPRTLFWALSHVFVLVVPIKEAYKSDCMEKFEWEIVQESVQNDCP